jgi:MarR family transcriptional regulator, transcriptional regulator for hemolysin
MQPGKSKLAWDPGNSAAFLLGRAARLFNRRAEERLRRLGFGAAHVPVLRALKDGNAMTQTELAAAAKIEQSTMAVMLARMVRDAVVRRTPNPDDRRSSLYTLTPAALAKVSRARDILVKGGEEMLAGFSPAEEAQLAALLSRAVANLED